MRILTQLKQQEKERDRIARMRQLEMERAEQLRRPTEDLLVRDLSSLPSMESMSWMRLPAKGFADLVMVFEFGNSFNEFLELDRVPELVELYAGLYNVKKGTEGLIQLTMQLVKAVVLEARVKVCPITSLHKIYYVSGSMLHMLQCTYVNVHVHVCTCIQYVCTLYIHI